MTVSKSIERLVKELKLNFDPTIPILCQLDDGSHVMLHFLKQDYIYPFANCPTPALSPCKICIVYNSKEEKQLLEQTIGPNGKEVEIPPCQSFKPHYFETDKELQQFLEETISFRKKFGKPRWTFPYSLLGCISQCFNGIHKLCCQRK